MAKTLGEIYRNSAARNAEMAQRERARKDQETGRETLGDFYSRAIKKGIDENPSTPSSRVDRDYLNGISSWINSTASRLNTYANQANKTGTAYGAGASLASQRQDIDALMQTAQEYADYLQGNADVESVLGTVNYNRLSQGVLATLSDIMRFDRTERDANRGSLNAVNRYLATDEGKAQIQPYLEAQEEAQRRQEEQQPQLNIVQQADRLRALQQRKAELDDIAKRIDPTTEIGGREYDSWLVQSRQIDEEIKALQSSMAKQSRQNRVSNWMEEATSAPDFYEYSRKGAAIYNDPMPTNFFESVGRAFQGGSDIGNVVTYARDPKNSSILRNQNETLWGTPQRNAVGGNQTIYDNPLTLYQFMTDDEVAVYNYLLAKDNEAGTEIAQKFLNDLTSDLSKRRGERALQDTAMWAKENPVFASASSVVSSPVNGLAYIDAAINRVRGNETDPYSPVQLQTRGASTERGAVAESIQENVSEATGNQWAGDAASFLYQTGMSVADSMLNTAIGTGVFGAGSLGSAASALLMSGGAASSAYQDAIDRGADENTALAAGGWAGAFETLFEKVSVDSFIKTASVANKAGMLKNVLRQMGVEASEETATELANILSDTAIMGDLSNYDMSIAAYMAQGMTEEEARSKTIGDLALQVLEAGLGGALAGGISSSVGTGISAARARSIASNAIQNNSVDMLVNAGIQLGEDSDAYAVAQQIKNGEVDAKDAGQVARLVRTLAAEQSLPQNLVSSTPQFQQQQSVRENVSARESDVLMATARQMTDEQMASQSNTSAPVSRQSAETTAPSQRAYSAPVSLASETAPITGGEQQNGQSRSPAQRQAAQVSTAVSSSLPATNAETGESVSVSGFDEVLSDGSATVRTGSGDILALSDVEFSDPIQQQLYESAVKLENTNAARTFVGYYDSSDGGKIASYAQGFYAIYNRALKGASFEQAVSGSVASDALTPVQQRAAYMAGQNVRHTAQTAPTQEESRRDERKPQPREAQAQKTRAPKPKNVPGLARAYTESNLNAAQRRAVKENAEAFDLIDRMAKIAGAQVVVVPSLNGMELNGHTVESDANGMYDPRSGRIYIGLDAQEGALSYVTMHELVHYVKAGNETGYAALEKVVLDALRDSEEDVDALISYQRERFGYSEAAAREEVVCNSVPAVLSDAQYVEQLMQEDASAAQRIRRFVKLVVDRLRKQLGALSEGSRSWEQMGALTKDVDALRKIEEAFDAVAKERRSGTTSRNAQPKYSINPDFVRQYDAWDGKNKTISFHIGSTSEVLQKLGVDEKKIFWDSSKIVKIKEKHPAMTDAVIMQVPNILEQPIVVMESLTVPGRLAIFGEVMDKQGAPVLAVLELSPTGDRGHKLDLIKIASAYGKDVNPQHLLDKSRILYVDPNIKRTRAWLKPLGLRLPLGVKYGYNGSIAQDDTTVNLSVRRNRQGDDAKFSMKDTVERKGTLLAIHNLTGEKLRKFLALGGAPMPSIAVTRSDIEHSNFGDVSLLFDKSTIDPKASRRNVVYSADAWTPTFPTIEYEVNPHAEHRISQVIRELYKHVDPLFHEELRRIQYGLEDSLNRYGGEEGMIRAIMDNYGLKAAYLEEQGNHIAARTVRRKVEQGYHADRIERYQAIANVLGTEDPEIIGSMKLSVVRDQYGNALESILPGVTKSAIRLSGIIRQVQTYLKNRNAEPSYEIVTDSAATRQAVDEALDQTGYERWVWKLYGGIEGAAGVRNGKDPFTPAGNRRSFAQTHYPVTLENLAKAMSAQNNGNTKNVSGFNGIKTLRAGMAQRFKSIAEMHKLEGRLSNLSQEESDSINNALSNRMYDLMARIDQNRTSRGHSNDFMRMDYIGETMMEIADSGKYSVQNIRDVFTDAGMSINTNTAEEIRALLFDIQQMPVNLFEAKPERAVYTNEVRLAVLPDGKYPDIEKRLESLGIPVTHYNENVAGDRLRVMNSETTESLRFSLRDTEPADVKRLRRENDRLAKALDNARQQVRIITGSRISQDRIQKISGKIVREYKSQYAADALANDLRQIYTYVEATGENTDWSDVDSFGIGVARKVVESSMARDESVSSQFSDLLDYFRKTPLKLSENLREQIRNSFGSVSAFRREVGNRIRFAENGVELDVALGEIREMYPFLDAESMDIDTIVDLVDLTKPAYVNPYGDDIESAAADLWTRMQEDYVDAAIPPTFAERKKAQIDSLRAEMKKMRADADLAARMAEGRVRAQERRRGDERVQALRQRQAEQRQETRDRADRRKYRERIIANAKTLSDWLTAPNDKHFVPESMRTELANLVASINVGYGENTKIGANWRDRISRMLTEVKNANEAAPQTGGVEIDDETVDALSYLSGVISRLDANATLRDLSAHDLEILSNAIQAIKHQVINADKIFVNGRRESLSQIGNAAIDEANRTAMNPGNDKRKTVVNNALFVSNLKPVYFFRDMVGRSMRKVGNELFRGEDDYAQKMLHSKNWYAEVKRRYNVDRWQNVKNDMLSFKTEFGDDITLTREQALDIYAIDRREVLDTGTHHLRDGGIVFDRDANGKRVESATAHPLSEADIERITNWLTPQQKAYADELVDYMSTVLAEYGNRTSMRLVGYKKFTGQHYIPFHVSGEYVSQPLGQVSDRRGGSDNVRLLKNSGFTKSIATGANNPLVVENLTDVWTQHVQDMVTYSALAVAQNDLNRLVNYKRPNEAGRRQETMVSAILNAYGRNVEEYLKLLLRDLSGSTSVDQRDRITSKMFSRFRKAAVVGSLSVAIQQPSAYFRAFAVIPPQFARAGALDAYQESQRYSGTAVIKDIGGFDVRAGRGTSQWLTGARPDGAVDAIDQTLGKIPEFADAMTWGAIWNSVKAWTAHDTNLRPGSSEFLQEVGHRFDEVTRLTQVYDSTLSRSSLMRGRSALTQMLTSFMGEPTTSMNLLLDAAVHARDHGMEGKISLHAAALAFTSSTIVNAMLKSLIYAMRDDDDEKTFWEKYKAQVKSSLLGERVTRVPGRAGDVVGFFAGSDLSPITQIPILSDIASIVSGYGVSRSDMELIEDLWTTAVNLMSENRTTYAKIRDFIGAVGNFTGIPIRNLWRDTEAIVRTIGLPVADTTTNASSQKGTFERAYNALLDGDKAGYQRYMNQAEEMIRENITESHTEDGTAYADPEIEVQNRLLQGIRDALKADSRIVQMAQYRVTNWDYNAYMSLRNQLVQQGFPVEAINGAVSSAINDLEDTGVVESSPYSPDEWSQADLQRAAEEAIVTGDTNDVEQILASILEQNPDRDVKSAARKAYQAASNDPDDPRAIQLLEIFGYTQDDARGWANDAMRQEMYGMIDEGDYMDANTQIRSMKQDGMTQESIRDGIRSKYKAQIEEAVKAGDTQRVRELRNTLMNLNLYDADGRLYFTAARIDEWIRDAGKEE